MRAVVLEGPNQFGVKEVEKPTINQDEMLLKMERAAICGTDIRILEGKKMAKFNRKVRYARRKIFF